MNEADFIHQLHGTGMAFKLHQGGVDEVGGFFQQLQLLKQPFVGVGLVPQDVRAGPASGYSREKGNQEVHKVPEKCH